MAEIDSITIPELASATLTGDSLIPFSNTDGEMKKTTANDVAGLLAKNSPVFSNSLTGSVESLDGAGKINLSNVLDRYTGKYITLRQTTDINTDAQADGIIYIKYKNIYLKRVLSFLEVEIFGAVGDGTTDDYAALQACFDMAARIDMPIHLNKPKSFYRSSAGLVIANTITVIGKDSTDIFADQTRIVFDKSTDLFGINITSASQSAGTILKGFTIQEAGGHKGGYILDYNAADGKILYQQGPSSGLTSGNVMLTRSPGDKLAGASTGGFTVASTSVTCNQLLSFYNLKGTFQVGQTITAGNGATMVIQFVSKNFPGVAGFSITGVFNANDTLTTPTGTAQVTSRLTYTGTTLVNVSNVTGNPSAGDIMHESGYLKTGILMQRRAHISEMRIVSFSGCGGAVPGDISNVNCFIWEACLFQSNGASGLNLEGTDANAGNTKSCTFVSNMGFAINDISFLGNTHAGNHSSLNYAGAYFAGNYSGRYSLFLNCYSESSPSRYPFYELSSRIGGASMAIGGVRGVDVDSGSDNLLRGTDLSFNYLKNGFIDTYEGPRGKKLIVTAPTGSTTGSSFAVGAYGNQGTGRGIGLDFLGPNDNQTHIDYASLFATRFTSNFALQLKVREFLPYTLIVKNADGSASSGSGALFIANISNGAFTSVEVVNGGSGYAIDSIITINSNSGEAVTTTAVLYPIIRGGSVSSVKVTTAGAGYLNSGNKNIIDILSTVFRPSIDNGIALGATANRFTDAYLIRVRTGAGLQQITSGTGIPEAVVTATIGSKYYQTDGAAGLKGWIKDTGTTATGWKRVQSVNSGTTASRPVLTNNAYDIGVMYTDTTLQKPVWWWGTAWKDATGATV